MFRKKKDTSHTHRAVEFPWTKNIPTLNMKPVGMFISAHRDGCEECTHKWARDVLQHPHEIAAFLGSSYAWALRQTKATPEDLINPPQDDEGEPLFRDASAALLRLGADGQIAEMLIWAREAPTSVRVDVLNDAGTAYGLERSALWTSSPEDGPPPWVETLGPALDYLTTTEEKGEGADEGDQPEPDPTPSPGTTTPAASGPPLVLGDKAARQFLRAGDPVPRWRRVGRWCLVHLERWAARWSFPPPPGGGPGERLHSTGPTTAPVPAGPPRPVSSPVAPDQDEDTDVPVGVVHGDSRVTLPELKAEVGDPPADQITTTKDALRALLWKHYGDTAEVREEWKATHNGTPPPSDLYRHAKRWTTDIAGAAVRMGVRPAEVPATLDTLGIHRTRAMDAAVSEWVDQHTTVTPLRRTG